MAKQITEQEMWDLIGFIKISPLRQKTLYALKDEYLIPSEIARKTGMNTTQTSGALIDLKEKNLVICMNESAHKGRIYQTTELGIEIIDFIESKKTRF